MWNKKRHWSLHRKRSGSYDSGDDFELQKISLALGSKQSEKKITNDAVATVATSKHCGNDAQSLTGSSSSITGNTVHEYQRMISRFYQSATQSPNFTPNFSFGIEEKPLQPLNVYNNCTINYNNAPQSPMIKTSRKRRIIIESDSDYSQDGW